jgi:hypothetical protein
MSQLPPHRNGLFEALPAHVLRSVDHDRLQALVDAEARARTLAVMDELCVPVQTVCYECRLSGGDPRVDVAVCLFAMRAAEVGGVLGRLGARHRANAAWRRCLEFLADWSSPASAFVPAIPFVCVAFDLPGDPAAVPAPSLSLCVDRDFFARQLRLPAPPSAPVSDMLALATACYSRLRGEPLPAACRTLLERCLSGDEAVLARHFSFMVSRTPATFKLDVRLPVEGIAPLLRRIGWPGDVPRVIAGIRELMPWPGHVQLNLVIHPTLGPALGPSLEVELLTGRGEIAPADRLALVQKLVAAGHCDPAKAGALRDAWAQPISRASDGLIVARSWYVKVRFDGDRIAEAKAYLGLMPRVLCGPGATLGTAEPASEKRP